MHERRHQNTNNLKHLPGTSKSQSLIVGHSLLQQFLAHGCVALNQLQYLLHVGDQTETILEKLLLRLNEQGLQVSSPWVLDQEHLLVEVLWPRIHLD